MLAVIGSLVICLTGLYQFQRLYTVNLGGKLILMVGIFEKVVAAYCTFYPGIRLDKANHENRLE
jgi:hypothetical protein